jgi:hypothetical protein
VSPYAPQHIFPPDLEAFNVDVGGLRKFYRSDPAARLVLDVFASRRSQSRLTTVSSLVSLIQGNAIEISPKDVVRVFKALQTFNCGEYISGFLSGNRNKQARFVWSVSLISVGRSATDKKIR